MEIQNNDVLKIALKKYFENPKITELKELLKFSQAVKIDLDDPKLEIRILKEKRGVELENLLKEYQKLKNFRKLVNLMG